MMHSRGRFANRSIVDNVRSFRVVVCAHKPRIGGATSAERERLNPHSRTAATGHLRRGNGDAQHNTLAGTYWSEGWLSHLVEHLPYPPGRCVIFEATSAARYAAMRMTPSAATGLR
jgi:hypothetical protein